MFDYLKNILVAGAMLMHLSVNADLSQPYASVHNLPYTPYFVLDGYTIYNMINQQQAAVIVDVDSQDGSVARFIAQEAPNLPSVQTIFSISMWQTKDPSQKHLYQRFLSNVINEGTSPLITPIRMSSLEGANSLNIVADFVYLLGKNDGNCIYNEILAWVPHLSDTGIICGNNWLETSVQVGVIQAVAALEMNLQINGNVWYLQKNLP